MRRRRLPFLALLAVALLGACQPSVAYSEGTGRRVFVTGDSLVHDSAGVLDAALIIDGYRSAIVAAPGSGIGWAAEQLGWQLADPPDVAVVAAGTNSWTGGWDRADRAAVDAVMAMADGLDCVVWVTPATWLWTEGVPRRAPFYDTVIAAIEDAADDHPSVRVARWDRFAAGRSAWYADDGVHHNARGRAAYARYIRDSVALCD